MRLNFYYKKHLLTFKFDAGTSRGILKERHTYFIILENETDLSLGFGEASPLKGLSIDYHPDFEQVVIEYGKKFREVPDFTTTHQILKYVNTQIPTHFPALKFAFETALLDLFHGGKRKIFDNSFYNLGSTIPINGLIWMGTPQYMKQQIADKIERGFNCIKIKIGAIDFEQEISVLQDLRATYQSKKISLRVDANGAFSEAEVTENLVALSNIGLHSIEQPVQPGQWEVLQHLCRENIVPVALDEELIGTFDFNAKSVMLETIKPQFIVLKPTLLGGFLHTMQWIELAEKLNIGWWITSALESNIGLNAITQFTMEYAPVLPQGLGTGQLYTNNLNSPLEIHQGHIRYNVKKKWKLPHYKNETNE